MALCSVDGCSKPSRRLGMCEGHYTHMRRGQPIAVLRDRKPSGKTGAQLEWLKSQVSYEGDDCLTWPFGRNADGRGQVSVENATRQAHRVMCELRHGAAPTPEHEAAHSCGHGHDGCINPNHLRWATHAENMADQLAHDTRVWGERHPFHKLTEQQVIEIRKLAGNATYSNIAARFGVVPGTVSKIVLRQRWGHI